MGRVIETHEMMLRSMAGVSGEIIDSGEQDLQSVWGWTKSLSISDGRGEYSDSEVTLGRNFLLSRAICGLKRVERLE